MANPTLLTQPFAANGDKNIIPNTTTAQGAFSQDKGFPAECSLPLGAGGVAPSRQDFNGAFNMLSSLMYYAQKGYTWHWDAGQEYFVGCVVIDDTNGNMYQCIQDVAAGGSVPSTDATNWKLDTVDMSSRANTDLSNLSVTGEAKLVPTNADFVVDSYSDDNGNWWRKHKSGWVEQGGIVAHPNSGNTTINLNTPMLDDNYLILTQVKDDTTTHNNGNSVGNRKTTTFVYASQSYGSNYYVLWYACGMGGN